MMIGIYNRVINFMKLLRNKKIIISVTVILALVICFMLISFFRNTSNFFEIKIDNDKSSYCSNEYNYSSHGLFNSRYLSYNDGRLIAKNRNGDNITAYSPTDKKSFSVPKDAYMLKNKLFYVQNKKLYCKNIDTNDLELIDNDCDDFVFNDEIIAYTKDKNIYIKEINGFNTKGVINLKNEIYYLSAVDDNLYLIERVYNTQEKMYGTNLRPGKQYIFSKYNANTLELVSSVTKDFVNSIKYIAVCKDIFYFYYDETQAIYAASLDGNYLPPIQYKNVIDIVSNNENIFFVSEKSEKNIIRTTVECETNGIWKVDVSNNTLKKVSDKCAFDNILATENYVYCYKIIYSLPRGMDTMFAIGYSLDQIPIV